MWRDFYDARIGRGGKPLAKQAHNFFMKAIKDRSTILFSDTLVWELGKNYPKTEIEELLGFLDIIGLLKRIPICNEEHIVAKKISLERNLPFVDCLNALHARKYNAVLVSQDKHFFRYLSDICVAVSPQNV
ncbi:MAG: PIN domain-containing protein [Nanoarchaeota archaeon]|nr:PIN domain-containing protein [Nanoarchaeota archaeon]